MVADLIRRLEVEPGAQTSVLLLSHWPYYQIWKQNDEALPIHWGMLILAKPLFLWFTPIHTPNSHNLYFCIRKLLNKWIRHGCLGMCVGGGKKRATPNILLGCVHHFVPLEGKVCVCVPCCCFALWWTVVNFSSSSSLPTFNALAFLVGENVKYVLGAISSY